MATITNAIQIQGALAPIFDLITTTRFWPQWHPATIGVGGVTTPADYFEYRAAGADMVMSATGAMWNPHLAIDIKKESVKK